MTNDNTSAGGAGLNKNHENYFVPGLQRGLRVLEALASERRPLSTTEIAKMLSLTRSSAFRLTYTLRHMGFLELAPGSKDFILGPRVLNIGFAYLSSKSIIETARPELERLRDNTNVSSHLGIRDGREVLYLSCAQTRSGFLSNMNVGARVPAYATPLGWLLLSDLRPREITKLFSSEDFEAFSPHTPKSIDELMTRVTDASRRGYVISNGLAEVGGSSVSAPIFDDTGNIIAAIDISGPDSAFKLEDLRGPYKDAVTSAAERISTRLGYVDKDFVMSEPS